MANPSASLESLLQDAMGRFEQGQFLLLSDIGQMALRRGYKTPESAREAMSSVRAREAFAEKGIIEERHRGVTMLGPGTVPRQKTNIEEVKATIDEAIAARVAAMVRTRHLR